MLMEGVRHPVTFVNDYYHILIIIIWNYSQHMHVSLIDENILEIINEHLLYFSNKRKKIKHLQVIAKITCLFSF